MEKGTEIAVEKGKKESFVDYMSIKSVEYLSWPNCLYNVIGQTDRKIKIAQIGRVLVFEVTRTWICLRCCKIQDQRVYIREEREN